MPYYVPMGVSILGKRRTSTLAGPNIETALELIGQSDIPPSELRIMN